MKPRSDRTAVVLNIGNTTAYCGCARGLKVERAFRVPLSDLTSDRAFAEKVAARLPAHPDAAAISSVVPELTSRIVAQVRQNFGVSPRILTAAAAHGLDIRYDQPSKLGTDRIACAIGARALYPRSSAIVVDCGTATTFTLVDRNGVLHGGAILPGIGLWGEMLAARTAQLPRVPVEKPATPIGRSPRASIASGIFHGHAGSIREVVEQIRKKRFPRGRLLVLGTGGYAHLFKRQNLFTKIEPRLILTGLSAFALDT